VTLLRGQADAAADNLSQSHALVVLERKFRNAEATLAALRTRQAAMTAAEEALDELTSTPARIEDRLGQAGFDPVTRPTAATVLARLRPLAITQS
jgi:hypothetical protein